MGLGVAAAIRSSDHGTVIAVFAKAVYVRFPTRVVAITVPSVPMGPLHVRWSIGSTPSVVGDTFVVPSSWRDHAIVWRGELPDPGAIGAEVVTALASLAARSALLRAPLVQRWKAATVGDDLAIAVERLGGLGPGLTPSGDDALAGLLLGARLLAPDTEAELVDLAERVDTHEISRSFLSWAARGQSIEPVHRLLAGDTSAAADLATFGHSSGADLALGLLQRLRPLRAGTGLLQRLRPVPAASG
jgi:hypothetical protein